MARDRTAEFVSTIKLMEGKPQWMNNELRSRKKTSNVDKLGSSSSNNPDYFNFIRGSRAVGRELCLVYEKLEKLNALAKKRTIFDGEEASKELNELVYIIKQDINSLNKQIEALKQYQMESNLKSSHNLENHSKNVVLSLQQKLASVSGNFKSTLELRSQNMQQQKMRREQFTGTSLPSSSNYNGTTVIDFENSSSYNPKEPLLPQSQSQQMLLYEDNTHQYLEERASTMQSIESTIVELGTIFNQLATIVQQQDEMITRIDSNVADTSLNVEAAHESLLRYFQTVNNNRWLILKVFGVLFFFFILFIVFA